MLNDFENKCQLVCNAFEIELQKIRTGRAHPGFLDSVHVVTYGQITPLKQMASISVQDAKSLAVTPWDKSLINNVAKAIIESDLGVNPSVMGDKLMVSMPLLTKERRDDLVKLVYREGEKTKINLRHHRRDVLAIAKTLVKNKEFTEDDEKRFEKDVDKIMDKFIKNVESIIASKEKDLQA